MFNSPAAHQSLACVIIILALLKTNLLKSSKVARRKVVKMSIVLSLPYFCLIVHIVGFVVHNNFSLSNPSVDIADHCNPGVDIYG